MNKKWRDSKISLSWPPSLSTAWTKQRWRSGVHLSLGTLDLAYGLTPLELAFSLSSTMLLLELPLLLDLLSSSPSSLFLPEGSNLKPSLIWSLTGLIIRYSFGAVRRTVGSLCVYLINYCWLQKSSQTVTQKNFWFPMIPLSQILFNHH